MRDTIEKSDLDSLTSPFPLFLCWLETSEDHLNENMQELFIEGLLWKENQPASPVVGGNSKAGREESSLTYWSHSRETPKFTAPLPVSPFTPP